MKVLLAAIILVGICVLLMSVGILLKRGFPKYDIGSNEKLRARGIVCYKDEDAALHKPRTCSGSYSDACLDCSLFTAEASGRVNPSDPVRGKAAHPSQAGAWAPPSNSAEGGMPPGGNTLPDARNKSM